MPDFLAGGFDGAVRGPMTVLGRLLIAFVLGVAVAFIYRRTRGPNETTTSFVVTLVLLSILIAMVTQVIGDNVARAFSLVGALSIVRFRTVVRDTQDTAYVIFAVAVGMAVGAAHSALAVSGILVVAFAAFVLKSWAGPAVDDDSAYLLNVRIGLGHEPSALLAGAFEAHVARRQLVSLATARQGMSLDAVYRITLRPERAVGDLVKALNRIEGVQAVTLQLADRQE